MSYLVGIYGGNYAQPDQTEPGHWAVCQTLSDAREYLENCARNMPHAASVWADMADGSAPLGTPLYGGDGDGALIYWTDGVAGPVKISGTLSDALDGASFDYPTHVAKFGPRGGLKITRA